MAPGAFESQTFSVVQRRTFLEIMVPSDAQRTRGRRTRSEDASSRHFYASCSPAGDALSDATTREESLSATPRSLCELARSPPTSPSASSSSSSRCSAAEVFRGSSLAEPRVDACPENGGVTFPEDKKADTTLGSTSRCGVGEGLQDERPKTGAVTFLAGEKAEPTVGSARPGWSKGSTLHVIGLCKPCGFVWSLSGCHAGPQCMYCHLHDRDWRKWRSIAKKQALLKKREEVVKKRMRARQPQEVCASSPPTV